jgi:hypothetical protein
MELPGSLERLHELVRNAAFPSFFAPVVPFERESVRIHGFELGRYLACCRPKHTHVP